MSGAGLPLPHLLMCLHAAHYNRSRAAAMATVSRRTLERLMRAHRIKAPRNQCKLTPHDVRLVRALLAGGMSYREVAKKFDTSANTIHKISTRQTWQWV